MVDDPPVGHGSLGESPDTEPLEKRMIGDFDGGANTLWTLYGREAKSYDEARILSLKDDMDGVLIFVRSYLVHSRKKLRHTYPPLGWFIFRCPHHVHNRQQTGLESQLRRPNGLLPSAK